MKIGKIFLVTLCVIITAGQMFGQSHPQTNKPKVSHEMPSVKDEKKFIAILFPDFLQNGLTRKGDTTFSYEYYDRNLLEMNAYDIKSNDDIDHIIYYKMFCRFSKDVNSNISAPTEFIIQSEFIHPRHDLWLRYDRMEGEITRYKIYENKIVGIDTVTINAPMNNNQRNFIYKYFKTEIISKEKGESHMH